MTSTWYFLLAWLTMIYIERIGQENNVDGEFTEDVRTFLMSGFLIDVWLILFEGVENIN